MSSAFAALGLAFRALLNGAETVANEVKHITGFYLKGLLVLALLAIFLPIPFVVAGVYWDLRWLIALGAMGWGICTLGLAVLGSPVGILIEVFLGEPVPLPARVGRWLGLSKRPVHRYVRHISGILTAGMSLGFLACVLPLRGHLGVVPVLFLGALVLILTRAAAASRKFMGAVATGMLVILIGSLWFPETAKAVQERFRQQDRDFAEAQGAPKLVHLTCQQIENSKVPWFTVDGKARIWYYRTGTGEFELFDRAGRHPVHGEELQPATPKQVEEIIAHLRDMQGGGCEQLQDAPKRVSLTCEQIENTEFAFFTVDGKARVWYYRAEGGEYQLFDHPGHHPVYGVDLQPVTAQQVREIIAHLPSTHGGICGQPVEEKDEKTQSPPSVIGQPTVSAASPQVTTLATPPQYAAEPPAAFVEPHDSIQRVRPSPVAPDAFFSHTLPSNSVGLSKGDGRSNGVDTAQVFIVVHRHSLGSCTGQLQLGSEFAFLSFTNDSHSLRLPKTRFKVIEGGIRDLNGKAWHFEAPGMPAESFQSILEHWYRGQ